MHARSLPAALLTVSILACAASASDGGVTRFCGSGAAGARLDATGSTSLDAAGGSGDLVLRASQLPPSSVVVLATSRTAQPPLPLGQGSLCVGGAAHIWRLATGATGGGESAVDFPVDYLAPPAFAATITPGSSWSYQAIFRAAGSQDTTDALAIDFVPPQPVSAPQTVAYWTRSGHPLGQIFEGGVVLINDDATWQSFWDLHAGPWIPQPPRPTVDFGTTTLVAAFAGRRLSSGYSIEVEQVALSVNTLEVSTLERTPGPGCGTLFSETNPMHVVAFRRVPGAQLGTRIAQAQPADPCP